MSIWWKRNWKHSFIGAGVISTIVIVLLTNAITDGATTASGTHMPRELITDMLNMSLKDTQEKYGRGKWTQAKGQHYVNQILGTGRMFDPDMTPEDLMRNGAWLKMGMNPEKWISSYSVAFDAAYGVDSEIDWSSGDYRQQGYSY